MSEAFITQNSHDRKRTNPHQIMLKKPSVRNKEIILKSARKKHQVTYKDKPIRITRPLSINSNVQDNLK
jgi:hypothetical protein